MRWQVPVTKVLLEESEVLATEIYNSNTHLQLKRKQYFPAKK